MKSEEFDQLLNETNLAWNDIAGLGFVAFSSQYEWNQDKYSDDGGELYLQTTIVTGFVDNSLIESISDLWGECFNIQNVTILYSPPEFMPILVAQYICQLIKWYEANHKQLGIFEMVRIMELVKKLLMMTH